MTMVVTTVAISVERIGANVAGAMMWAVCGHRKIAGKYIGTTW